MVRIAGVWSIQRCISEAPAAVAADWTETQKAYAMADNKLALMPAETRRCLS